MAISPQCCDFLITNEAIKTQVYQDSSSSPTIGVGHLLTKAELQSGKLIINNIPVRWSKGLTHEIVRALLMQDLHRVDIVVTDSVKVSTTQNQHDALVVFCFNIGTSAFRTSTLLKLLNKGDYRSVPKQMKRWNKVDGKVNEGLVNRRNREIALWLKG